ncbi:cytochrome P450 [Nocardia sp. NBC_00881]|uniref:cytochrome P450 n=1 Tax=Nocardia sp. NBC_00881 TaxID=2975995 RepID=UPI0038691474|nr:cytochrome P450 [Nocardia sp. NBC_00881]
MRSDPVDSEIPLAPGRLPLLGHIPILLRAPLPFVCSVSGLGPVVRVQLAGTTNYLVTDPALVRQVLVADVARFSKGVHYDKLRALLGNSLSTTSGVHHRDRRRLMQPAFHQRQISHYADLIRHATTRLVGEWREGQVVAVDDAMRQLSLTIAAEALCSTALRPQAMDVIQRDLPVVMRGVAWRVLLPSSTIERLPLPANRRFQVSNKRLRQIVAELVARYRSEGIDHGDLLSLLLTARHPDTGVGMEDNQIRDEIVNLLFAATETTGNAMAWLWHAVAGHPEVQQGLRGSARSSTTDYARRVARETLRLYPPPWLVSRQTREPVQLGPYRLPADAPILFSPYAIQRHPDNFPSADRFDPDRWLPDRLGESNRHAYLAFGAGPQNCIGEGFAMLEIATVATTIAAYCRLVPTSVTVETASATLVPSQLRMTVRMM